MAPRHARLALQLLALWVASLLPGYGSARAQAADERLAQLQAAYLVNFVRYTDWPPQQFAAADSPLVIGVLGDPGMVEAMRAIVDHADPIGVRRLELRALLPPGAGSKVRKAPLRNALASCHVVFLDNRAGHWMVAVLELAQDRALLTVSDAPGFAAAGGMFELARAGSRIVFDANPQAIRAAGLGVSARVLKLARALAGEPL